MNFSEGQNESIEPEHSHRRQSFIQRPKDSANEHGMGGVENMHWTETEYAAPSLGCVFIEAFQSFQFQLNLSTSKDDCQWFHVRNSLNLAGIWDEEGPDEHSP